MYDGEYQHIVFENAEDDSVGQHEAFSDVRDLELRNDPAAEWLFGDGTGGRTDLVEEPFGSVWIVRRNVLEDFDKVGASLVTPLNLQFQPRSRR